jgi:group I intron endonuclease
MGSTKQVRYTIYCHTHVDSERHYVGLTKKTMLQRWNNHVLNAKKKSGRGCTHFWNAIRKYGKDAFSHEVLEICTDLDQANLAEEWWIRKLGSRNTQLGFNLKRGGDHTPHPIKNPWDRPGFREKCASNIDRFNRECHSPETYAKIKVTISTPEFKAKHAEKSREALSRPEVKRKMTAALTGRKLSVEHRAKISENQRGRVTSQEIRDKIKQSSKGKVYSPETLEKRAIASKTAWANPAQRSNRLNILAKVTSCPEARAKMSAAAKKPRSEKFKQAVAKSRRAAIAAGKGVKYVVVNGKITHKICPNHGLVPIEACYVNQRSSGTPLVLCKACRKTSKKRINRAS